MTVARTASAAAGALCALGLAAAGTAASAPPDLAQALGARDEAMTARYAAMGDQGSLTIPHDADREDVSAVAPEPAVVSGERWAADAHRIAQSTPSPAGGIDGVSFDWRDAGAGALAALGVVALLALGAYGLRSRAARRPASGAAS